jgi:hypothetical protein
MTHVALLVPSATFIRADLTNVIQAVSALLSIITYIYEDRSQLFMVLGVPVAAVGRL